MSSKGTNYAFRLSLLCHKQCKRSVYACEPKTQRDLNSQTVSSTLGSVMSVGVNINMAILGTRLCLQHRCHQRG